MNKNRLNLSQNTQKYAIMNKNRLNLSQNTQKYAIMNKNRLNLSQNTQKNHAIMNKNMFKFISKYVEICYHE